MQRSAGGGFRDESRRWQAANRGGGIDGAACGLLHPRLVSTQQGRQTADQLIPEADIQRGSVSAASRPGRSFIRDRSSSEAVAGVGDDTPAVALVIWMQLTTVAPRQ
jgi:hypothetical protein